MDKNIVLVLLKTSSSGILPLDGFHAYFELVKIIVAIPLSYKWKPRLAGFEPTAFGSGGQRSIR